MKKLLKFIPVLIAVAVAIFTDLFFLPHTLKTTLIEEIKYDNSCSYAYGEKYFFIKDEDYNGFYDGKAILGYYLPEYDLSGLDTDKYTYFVTVEGKIASVKYNGLNCKRRTVFAIPDEYEAIIESEETADGIIRIYRMKKINIDYDYHS